jgi:hypothetical protein
MTYLCHYYEPDDNIELTRMQQRAKAYLIINNELYKTSVIGTRRFVRMSHRH